MSDKAFYVKELASEECFCGRKMGFGYELAYEEAVRWLGN